MVQVLLEKHPIAWCLKISYNLGRVENGIHPLFAGGFPDCMVKKTAAVRLDAYMRGYFRAICIVLGWNCILFVPRITQKKQMDTIHKQHCFTKESQRLLNDS